MLNKISLRNDYGCFKFVYLQSLQSVASCFCYLTAVRLACPEANMKRCFQVLTAFNCAICQPNFEQDSLDVQALARRPDDKQLQDDLQEVNACLQPASSSTLRRIADDRFKSQVCWFLAQHLVNTLCMY